MESCCKNRTRLSSNIVMTQVRTDGHLDHLDGDSHE